MKMFTRNMAEFRGSSRYSKRHTLVRKITSALYKERDVWLRVWVNRYSVEPSREVEDMYVSMSGQSQLFCTNVALRHRGDFSDSIDTPEVLAHTPFDWCILCWRCVSGRFWLGRYVKLVW